MGISPAAGLKTNMKIKTKFKRKIKQNFGKILIIGNIALVGVAANLNLMALEWPIDANSPIITNQQKTQNLSLKSEKITLVDVSKGTIREITMYNSVPEQTDSTPCVSADGTNICKVDYNVCATNAFPFGTRLYIDKLGECIVKDRMNPRYQERVDWYAGMDVERAVNFGKQKLLTINL